MPPQRETPPSRRPLSPVNAHPEQGDYAGIEPALTMLAGAPAGKDTVRTGERRALGQKASANQSGPGRLVRIRFWHGPARIERVTGVEMSSSSMNRRDGGVFRRAGLTVALALAALAAVPAIASAASVSTFGTVIFYAADPFGETNNLTVTQPGADTYVFDEASISITESS